jgi:hypothetical protein
VKAGHIPDPMDLTEVVTKLQMPPDDLAAFLNSLPAAWRFPLWEAVARKACDCGDISTVMRLAVLAPHPPDFIKAPHPVLLLMEHAIRTDATGGLSHVFADFEKSPRTVAQRLEDYLLLWQRRDLDSALAAVRGLTSRSPLLAKARLSFLYDILEHHPGRVSAAEVASVLPAHTDRTQRLEFVAAKSVVANPQQTLKWAIALDDPQERFFAINGALEFGNMDFPGFWELADQIAYRKSREAAITNWAEHRWRANHSDGLEAALAVADPRDRFVAVRGVLSTALQAAPKETVSQLNALIGNGQATSQVWDIVLALPQVAAIPEPADSALPEWTRLLPPPVEERLRAATTLQNGHRTIVTICQRECTGARVSDWQGCPCVRPSHSPARSFGRRRLLAGVAHAVEG